MSVLIDLLFLLIEVERALNILDSVNLEFYCTMCFVVGFVVRFGFCGVLTSGSRITFCTLVEVVRIPAPRLGSPSLLGPFSDPSSLPTYLNNWINVQHQSFSQNSTATSAVCCGDILSQSCHCRVRAPLCRRIFASMFLILFSLVSR